MADAKETTMNLTHLFHRSIGSHSRREAMKYLFLMIGAKRAVWLSVLFLLLTFPVMAQSDKRTDLFVGYSHMRGGNSYIDTAGHINFVNKNGWHTNMNVDLFKYFGIAADVSGNYGLLDEHTLLVGPRFSTGRKRFTLFSQHMFGVANVRGRLREYGIPIDKNSKTSFTSSSGVGFDINLSDKFAIRAIQTDFLFNQVDFNIRLSAGFVFRFRK
jgi:hypothetical protein